MATDTFAFSSFSGAEPPAQVADVFYDVDEQLRSARLKTMFRRGWPYAAGLLALVIVAALCVWAWRAHEASEQGADSQRYADGMAALGVGDTASAQAKFASLAKDGTPTYRALALMQQAGLKLKADDAPGAAALFDQAAAAAHDPLTIDGAKLRAAFLLMDTAPYDQVRARLKPLTASGHPFRMLALEGLAVAELANGQTAEAKGDFQVLSLSSDVSDASRARATAALSMIQSGSGANIAAIARSAIGLKPSPPPAAPAGLTPEQGAALQAQAQAAKAAQSGGQDQTAGAAAPAPASSGTPQ